jgi:DNA-binding NarL/FixJ family response regulator
MTEALARSERSALNLLLVDDDPIFRVGVRACFSEYADLQIVAEADSYATALQVLQSRQTSEAAIDLVLLNLAIEASISAQGTGLALCRQLKAQYPTLPILLLSAVPEPPLLAAAFQIGVEGYCPKGTAIADFANIIRRVATGQTAWDEGMQVIAQAVTRTQPVTLSSNRTSAEAGTVPIGFLASWRYNTKQSGLQQIDTALATINAQLAQTDLTVLERLVLTGQRRELRAARWVVNRLLQSSPPPAGEPASPEISSRRDRSLPPPPPTRTRSNPTSNQRTSSSNLATVQAGEIRTFYRELGDRTFAKLQANLQNLTDIPLEIDILSEDKKRELLSIILQKFEESLNELRFSQVLPNQLVEKQALVLQDLWQAATIDFFGKYYTLDVGQQALEIVNVFLSDAGIVQIAILNKLPLVPDLLAALLFQTPIVIDNVAYPPHTPEAMARLEMVLQNLLIQVGNAVVQPLLNHFADVETIKRTFYDRHLLPTREVERFRNNLSWKYRTDYWFVEPKAIFESQHRLFVLNGRGIRKTSVYAPRTQELAELSGIRYAVTLALETRDAIAPRLRSALAFVGSGVVYILTEVVGRGIGLIGRGIIKGIGNALQENKLGRN